MTTTPPPMPEALNLADWLDGAKSTTGWPSYVPQEAAFWLRNQHERITALEAEIASLRKVLGDLLDDTQHAEHPDCEDGPCPVRAARAALESKR